MLLYLIYNRFLSFLPFPLLIIWQVLSYFLIFWDQNYHQHMIEIMWVLYSCAWLISLNKVLAANIRILFFYCWIIVYVYICASHFLYLVFCQCVSKIMIVDIIPSTGIAGSYDSDIFNLFEDSLLLPITVMLIYIDTNCL